MADASAAIEASRKIAAKKERPGSARPEWHPTPLAGRFFFGQVPQNGGV